MDDLVIDEFQTAFFSISIKTSLWPGQTLLIVFKMVSLQTISGLNIYLNFMDFCLQHFLDPLH